MSVFAMKFCIFCFPEEFFKVCLFLAWYFASFASLMNFPRCVCFCLDILLLLTPSDPGDDLKIFRFSLPQFYLRTLKSDLLGLIPPTGQTGLAKMTANTANEIYRLGEEIMFWWPLPISLSTLGRWKWKKMVDPTQKVCRKIIPSS